MIDKNAVWCLNCNTVIESKERHDLQSCMCIGEKSVYVDGGHDYQRIGFGKLAKFKLWGKGGWGQTKGLPSGSSSTTEDTSPPNTDGSN